MTEKVLHRSVCSYLKLQYKDVLFNTDLSGIKLTIGQAKQAKMLRSGRAFPDLVIYHPGGRKYGKKFALFLEFKKESPYKKDGTLKKDKHLQEQHDMLQKLNSLGYLAYFVWNFDMAKELIDEYLNR